MVSSRPHRRVRAPLTEKMHPNASGRRRPGAKEVLHFRVPPSLAGPKCVFLTCHYCGYDPPVVPTNGMCPKCGGHSWERYALSARLVPKGYL